LSAVSLAESEIHNPKSAIKLFAVRYQLPALRSAAKKGLLSYLALRHFFTYPPSADSVSKFHSSLLHWALDIGHFTFFRLLSSAFKSAIDNRQSTII
jgi:hypothetical protein